MALQTVTTNRRTFLERSALGAGSVLFLPGLLASCADHRTPDPDPFINPPLIGNNDDDFYNFNDEAKITIVHILGMIPVVGEALSGIVDLLWPATKVDVWGKVKEQVEALLNQKIDALVYGQVTADLTGLNNSTLLYLNEVKNGNANSIQSQWITTRNSFALALPHFQAKGYEVLLLPLFAQFAGMYLSILRDGVISGKSWGRTDADQQQDVTDLKNSIHVFVQYTNGWFDYGRNNTGAPQDPGACEPYRTVNKFVRHMTLSVLSFLDTWQYFDVTLYPTGAKVVLTRAIYSDPYGTCTDSGDIRMETPPTQGPTAVAVWDGDLIYAVQVFYPANSGPNGVSQTPLMGNQDAGGIWGPNPGRTSYIQSNNPIYAAKVRSEAVINGMVFLYYDATQSFVMGGTGGNDSGWLSYPNHFLSQIHINGVSKFYRSADSVVFGFQPWQPPAATLRAVRAIYVKSPIERSAADFAQAFPAVGITQAHITDEVKAARQAYWASVQTRAKALK